MFGSRNGSWTRISTVLQVNQLATQRLDIMDRNTRLCHMQSCRYQCVSAQAVKHCVTLDSGKVCEFSFRSQRSVIIHLKHRLMMPPHGRTRSTTVTSRLCQLWLMSFLSLCCGWEHSEYHGNASGLNLPLCYARFMWMRFLFFFMQWQERSLHKYWCDGVNRRQYCRRGAQQARRADLPKGTVTLFMGWFRRFTVCFQTSPI